MQSILPEPVIFLKVVNSLSDLVWPLIVIWLEFVLVFAVETMIELLTEIVIGRALRRTVSVLLSHLSAERLAKEWILQNLTVQAGASKDLWLGLVILVMVLVTLMTQGWAAFTFLKHHIYSNILVLIYAIWLRLKWTNSQKMTALSPNNFYFK